MPAVVVDYNTYTASALENNVQFEESSNNVVKFENNVEINGKVDRDIKHGLPKVVHYIAPAPADHITSFSGSGLPFANIHQAFENTPNKGSTKVEPNGRFKFYIRSPNSYYKDFNIVQTPHVTIRFDNDTEELNIDLVQETIPHRVHRSINDKKPNTIKTQEQLFRDTGYHN